MKIIILLIEKLHLQFYCMLLGVNNKTSKCMVCVGPYGELGGTPLQSSIDQNVLNFGAKIVNANDKQFSGAACFNSLAYS